MVESSPSRQRRSTCKTNKEMSDEAADAAALTYLLTLVIDSLSIGPLFRNMFCKLVVQFGRNSNSFARR